MKHNLFLNSHRVCPPWTPRSSQIVDQLPAAIKLQLSILAVRKCRLINFISGHLGFGCQLRKQLAIFRITVE